MGMQYGDYTYQLGYHREEPDMLQLILHYTQFYYFPCYHNMMVLCHHEGVCLGSVVPDPNMIIMISHVTIVTTVG